MSPTWTFKGSGPHLPRGRRVLFSWPFHPQHLPSQNTSSGQATVTVISRCHTLPDLTLPIPFEVTAAGVLTLLTQPLSIWRQLAGTRTPCGHRGQVLDLRKPASKPWHLHTLHGGHDRVAPSLVPLLSKLKRISFSINKKTKNKKTPH